MQYVQLRNGKYQYYRRVPTEVAHLDRRPFVKVSLKTDSEVIARKRVVLVNQATEEYWQNLAHHDQGGARERYDAAVRLARSFGFPYQPVHSLATGDLGDLVSRVETVGVKGTDTIENAERIDLVQLKYSVAAPQKNWTLGRLTKSTAKTGNNSIARRLGNAFKAAAKGKSNQLVESQIKVSLVSNQPISSTLTKLIEKILKGSTTKEASELHKATGLSLRKFHIFCQCLNLKGGEAARSILKSNVVQRINSVTDSDVSGTLADLRQIIRERMLPESSSTPIKRETVFTWFRVGESISLFPCEAKLEKTEAPIARQVLLDLASATWPLTMFTSAPLMNASSTITQMRRRD